MAMLDIEAVVHEVVRRLIASAAPVNAAASAVTAAPTATAVVAPATAIGRMDSLSLADRVVTLEMLSGRLAGVRKLQVSPRAIVTPAVLDELKKQQIILERSAAAINAVQQTIAAKLIVALYGAKEIVERPRAAAYLAAACEPLDTAASTKLLDIAKELAFRVTSQRKLGLWLSVSPALSLAVVQKIAGVRAIQVATAGELDEAQNSLAPNIVILDPRKVTGHLVREITLRFSAGGFGDCPSDLQGIL